MVISEVREALKKYTEEELRKIVTELYKAMPKKLKEEKNIDSLIQDYNAFTSVSKAEKSMPYRADLTDLKPQIERFIEYAYNQYYLAPNSVIHKKERPKWRFIVKAFIKDMRSIPAFGEEGKTATELMAKLYDMLCHACAYYLFNTDDPFISAGIVQTELFDEITARTLANGFDDQAIRNVILLTVNSRMDRQTLSSDLIILLLNNFNTPDLKTRALEHCLHLRSEFDKKLIFQPKKHSTGSVEEYEKNEKRNKYTEIVFRLHILLHEYSQAAEYFNRNYVSYSKEITLYVLLEMIREYDLKELWISEYEKAVKNKVEPREKLQNIYKHIKENDSFPAQLSGLINIEDLI